MRKRGFTKPPKVGSSSHHRLESWTAPGPDMIQTSSRSPPASRNTGQQKNQLLSEESHLGGYAKARWC